MIEPVGACRVASLHGLTGLFRLWALCAVQDVRYDRIEIRIWLCGVLRYRQILMFPGEIMHVEVSKC